MWLQRGVSGRMPFFMDSDTLQGAGNGLWMMPYWHWHQIIHDSHCRATVLFLMLMWSNAASIVFWPFCPTSVSLVVLFLVYACSFSFTTSTLLTFPKGSVFCGWFGSLRKRASFVKTECIYVSVQTEKTGIEWLKRCLREQVWCCMLVLPLMRVCL